jgi:arginyl-tRNA--protein-N-Asp/Glu arginylyltransferase
MFSRIKYPKQLSKAELDEYLATGWRCMGQAIYTSHFMFFPPQSGKRVYSTLPSRLPLQGYAFRKSLRKIHRKVHQKFRVEVGQSAHFDAQKERVNQAYARQFPGKAINKPEEFLINIHGRNTFDTREVCVYDGDQLIAFSFFALGNNSIYSKQGIYDPHYRNYSLGFFTMLEEISFAIAAQLDYYYPGYVVPGYPEFDYKHRIGPLEYFDLPSDEWKPYSTLQEEKVPIHQMNQQLQWLKEELASQNLSGHLGFYRFFDIRFYDVRPFPFLEFPLILLIASDAPQQHCPIAVFHPQQQRFTLYNCRFFGRGVEHLDAYHHLLRLQPAVTNIPIAVFDTYLENVSEKEIIDMIQGGIW